MKIPFVDLLVQYNNISSEINNAIISVIKESAFIGGSGNKFVQKFEETFAKYLDIKNVITCANGTDSIEIILKANGIGPGDEVIVPALTWISTAESVNSCGAKPIFVDIEPDYYCIDSQKIEEKITKNTKAIIPVHLYGQPAQMDRIMTIAEKFSLFVLEDCAQSHGARFMGRMTGTIGHAGSFSFYPGKNLGAYGDAGAIVTNDDVLAQKCRMICNHGQKGKHNHLMIGRNSRLDGIQASILIVKLQYLETWTQKRIEIANIFANSITNKSIILPKVRPDCRHVFHLYVVQVDQRDNIQTWLKTKSIDTAIHYPCGIPFLKCYLNNDINFPTVKYLQDKILSLPMFPELTKDQIIYLCREISNINI